MKELFNLLKIHGGKIVTSNETTHIEIAVACSEGRMWVDNDAIGFIFLPKDYSAYRRATKGLCFETN